MKKTLKLKLIEVPTSYTPQLNDLIYHSEKGYSIYNGNFAFGKIHKPTAISDEEIKVGDMFITEKNDICKCSNITEYSIYFYQSDDYEYTTKLKGCKKIELLPEHFSNDILQLIVDGVLKDNDVIEVKYDYQMQQYPSTELDDVAVLVLDSNGKAIITVPEEDKELCIYCNKEIYQEHTRYNGRYFHKDSAMSNCFNSTNQAASKNTITSTDKTQEPITYSEEEVKELFTKLIQDYPVHSSRMRELIPKWFEQNKKK